MLTTSGTSALPTSALNRWFEHAIERASAAGGVGPLAASSITSRRPRAGRRALLCSARAPTPLPDAYKRYLVNSLRETFDLPGTPIRLDAA